MSAFRVSRTALPLSQVSATASFSRLASIRSAILSRMLERSVGDVLPQAGAALWAASSASSMSSALERGISQKTSPVTGVIFSRSEEHTSELQSRENLVCRLLLEKKK